MSNITLLPKNFKKLIDAKEIFVADFVAFYSNLVHIICGISMLLTLFVTYIIVKKTPSFMSNLKIYLIPYCVYSFVVEMVFATYTPLILHPFAYFYPTGILKNFHPKFAIVVVIFGATAALSLIDCSIGTILERTFALKNIEKLSNGLSDIFIPYLNLTITEKIPFFVFVFLFFTVLCCFLSAILIAFVESFYAYFLVPSDDISNIVNSNIYGLEEYINLNNLLIFQGSEQNTLPISIIFVGIMGWLRATIAAVLIPFNAYKSYKLNILMSAETKKCISILLKMCYLQFAGFFCFLLLPIFILTIIFRFSQTPNIYVNYCFVVMNCFNIYDTIVTIFCIKPYRTFVFSFLSFLKLPKIKKKQITVIAQID